MLKYSHSILAQSGIKPNSVYLSGRNSTSTLVVASNNHLWQRNKRVAREIDGRSAAKQSKGRELNSDPPRNDRNCAIGQA